MAADISFFGLRGRPTLIRALDAVFRNGPLARRQLRAAVGASASTTTEAVQELLARGLIVETDTTASTGGRPAKLLDLSPTLGIVLAADIGAMNVRVGAGSLRGKILARRTIATPAVADAEVLQQTLAEAMHGVQAEAGGGSVRALVVGLAAIVDALAESVSYVTVPGWREAGSTNLIAWLRTQFNGYPLVLENEANLAALGEYRYGSASGSNNMMFVAVGAGVGAGLVVNGSLFRGHGGAAGEIGLMRLCSGAAAVELDRLAGAEALLRRYREAGGAPVGDAESVFARAASGDAAARAVISSVIGDLAVGIANAINLFAPEKVVIGGGLADAGAIVLEPLRNQIQHFVAQTPEIVASSLGSDAALVGGLYLASEQAREAIGAELDGGRTRPFAAPVL